MSDRGRKHVLHYEQDTSSTALAAATWVEVSSAIGADINKVRAAGSATMDIVIAYGAASSEEEIAVLTVGTVTSDETEILIPKGVRVAISSLAGDISTGTLALDFYN